MKAFKLFIFLLFTVLANAKPKAIEMKTFKDYNKPITISDLPKKPDLRDSQVLLAHVEKLADQIERKGKAPKDTANTFVPFLAFGCNWPIVPGLILATTREQSPAREILWREGQRAFELAEEQQKNNNQ